MHLAKEFNGDGKVDLATVDEFQSKISILLGNGDGTFGAHTEFATGNHPVWLATGDVNGDGFLDIVVADLNDGKISVLLGKGDGTFQTHKDYGCGNGVSGLAIGDFNNDGKLDVVTADNTDDTAAILLGNGDGTFQGPIAFPTSHLPNSVIVGDFNGDGNLDLAVGTSNKSVSVLLGGGNGTFQNHVEYTIGANSVVVGTADLNSDGRQDLIAADFNDNTISTLTGNADGTFKGRSVFPTGVGPAGIGVGDFNGNGKLDIAVPASTDNKISVLTDTAITLSPNVLGFGKNTSGFVTAPKTVTLKNTGTTSYTMGKITFTGSSFNDFSETDTCGLPGSTIAAGASCTINVTFDPQACEVADAQMLITATSSGSVMGALTTGTGNIPITLKPRTMNFSTYQLIGTTAPPKTDTFTNDSGVDIVFSLIDLEGDNSDEFKIDPASSCVKLANATLAPGASCDSNILFTPTIAGGGSVTQVYYGNFCLVKQGLIIKGNGTAVNVSPTSLNFGNQKVGTTSAPKTVTFQNAGSTPMSITSVTFSGANKDWQQTNNCGTTVAASSSCTFSVTFTPGATGARRATMKIGDPDPTGPQSVSLSGTGN